MPNEFEFDGRAVVSAAETRPDDPPATAEGLVVRPIKTQWTIFRGSRVRVSFKAKSREFLLINKQ